MIKKYFSVISYILLIILVNACYSYLPSFSFGANEVSMGDFLVGWVYLVRDFAQRSVGHWIILAMLIGTLISFWLSDPIIAIASVAAFSVGEIIDWLIFTFTGKPLSERLIFSAGLSAPIDTVLFLWLAHHLNWLEFGVMTLVKCFGVFCLWWYWNMWQKRIVVNNLLYLD